MTSTSDASGKRAYETPVLTTYGDIGQLTHTVGKTGNIDGGPGNGKNKTLP